MYLKATRVTFILLASVLLLSGFVQGTNQSAYTIAVPHRNMRVLFIGNSYTIYNDLPWVTQQLALSAHPARPLQTEMVAMMGATLQEHWNDGTALRKLKQDGPWDYVVLQEQSTRALENPEAMRDYALLFNEEINKAGAQAILFVPWAHREHPENQVGIIDAYMSLAQEMDATVAPVGPAWQTALRYKPQTPLYKHDADSHPAAAGSYLAACVLYATIYGSSPEGVTASVTDQGMVRHEFDPLGDDVKEEPFSLSGSDARFLQRTAWWSVKELQ
ncbi:MAG: SGNH/GDSL hydrolase family protein [Acidobacteria bacterium]|nr:SGNH/GDSL hydrolase family protein [Acidobacteriota bacterium]